MSYRYVGRWTVDASEGKRGSFQRVLHVECPISVQQNSNWTNVGQKVSILHFPLGCWTLDDLLPCELPRRVIEVLREASVRI